MTFAEVVHALVQLRSFDHGACDAILKARSIDLSNAYDPRKTGSEDSVYVGFFVIVTWLVWVAVMTWMAFKGRLPTVPSDRHGLARWILPFFLIFGVVMLCAQLSGMAHYAERCRELLHL